MVSTIKKDKQDKEKDIDANLNQTTQTQVLLDNNV
jgi:hypothetical protein